MIKTIGKIEENIAICKRHLDNLLTLAADSLDMINTWVDALYAVHVDMKSHTGGVISFGRGEQVNEAEIEHEEFW